MKKYHNSRVCPKKWAISRNIKYVHVSPEQGHVLRRPTCDDAGRQTDSQAGSTEERANAAAYYYNIPGQRGDAVVWLEYQRQIRTAVDWYKKCTSICPAQRASGGGGPVTFRVMGPHLLATFPLPLFQFVRVTFISRARPQEGRQQHRTRGTLCTQNSVWTSWVLMESVGAAATTKIE